MTPMSKKNMKQFKKILRMTQEQVRIYVTEYLQQYYHKSDIISTKDYVYAVGKNPVGLVAHMDTVFSTPPVDIIEKDGVLSSPQGVGGDDRCGIYLILKLISMNKDNLPTVIFTTDEECGALGAHAFTKEIKEIDVKYLLELDRKGSKDACFYDCGNKEFQKFINRNGFKTAFGSFSDISVLSPKYDVSSVNLSVGYNHQHSKFETIDLYDMHRTLVMVNDILKKDTPYYDYQEVKSAYNFGSYGGYYGSYFGGYYSTKSAKSNARNNVVGFSNSRYQFDYDFDGTDDSTQFYPVESYSNYDGIVEELDEDENMDSFGNIKVDTEAQIYELCSYMSADEDLARALVKHGVPHDEIEDAILMNDLALLAEVYCVTV